MGVASAAADGFVPRRRTRAPQEVLQPNLSAAEGGLELSIWAGSSCSSSSNSSSMAMRRGADSRGGCCRRPKLLRWGGGDALGAAGVAAVAGAAGGALGRSLSPKLVPSAGHPPLLPAPQPSVSCLSLFSSGGRSVSMDGAGAGGEGDGEVAGGFGATVMGAGGRKLAKAHRSLSALDMLLAGSGGDSGDVRATTEPSERQG